MDTAIISASPKWSAAPHDSITGAVGYVFVVYCDGTRMRAGLWFLLEPSATGGVLNDPVVDAIYGTGTYRAVVPNMILLGTDADCGEEDVLAADGLPLWGGNHLLTPAGTTYSYPCHNTWSGGGGAEGRIKFRLGKGSCGASAPMMMMAMAEAPEAEGLAAAKAPPPPRRSLPCVHEGNIVEACKTCGPKEGRHVRQCLHPTADRDLCTRDRIGPLVQACADCPDYEPAQP